LQSARDTHQNLIRVWGGGIYESDEFYDLCDELGLCVWQDFMFACAAYPTDRADFTQSALHEANDNLCRIRHHASLALLCGNNELEMFVVGENWPNYPLEEYKPFFDVKLRREAGRCCPQVSYWPGSPHAPGGEWKNGNTQDTGDCHLWDVWHGRQPFEWYRTSHPRFCSEFGFQSFPEPRTIDTFTLAGDRNISSPVLEHHQRSGIGNKAIMEYMLNWFRMPSSFENTVWLSQIQ
jgi:beta-mannosidase